MAKHNKTVVVAMSGGVDSSVAAVLLHNKGYRVIGITMKLWDFEEVGGNINHESGCCSLESFNDARSICVSLGIPHYILNFSHEFHQEIVANFIDEYLSGRTPNPCIRCNTKIKWKTLLEKAAELSADFLATGHYARVSFNKKTNRFELLRGVDKRKDQSYALWGLQQHSLAKTIFPMGGYTKQQIREIARELNLPTAEKSESQEICFIPDNNYHRLLKIKRVGLEQELSNGPMVTTNGDMIGYHKGYPFYTIGQRKGLGGGFNQAMYVVDIDADRNRIIIGTGDELLCKEFIVKDMNYISLSELTSSISAQIKIRYNDEPHPGTLIPQQNNRVRVAFRKPQRAITPGQSAVFFDDDVVIGGGIIEHRLN